jgi:hypothetical protein
MIFVILDKSYLDGTSKAEVDELAKTARFVISAALFHEMLTTRPESRVRCFSKLPQTDNPVALVERAGNMASLEMTTSCPAGLPSANLVEIDGAFRFNKKLLDLDYTLPPESSSAVEEKRLDVEESIDSLIELSETVPGIFPDLTVGSTEQRKDALRRAEIWISDPNNVANFLFSLVSPELSRPFPNATKSPEKWASIALLQARLLFVTHLYFRYQGKLADIMTPKVRLFLEHDVHDAEILALGILEGALATKEHKLRRWFKLLRPSGLLFPSDA